METRTETSEQAVKRIEQEDPGTAAQCKMAVIKSELTRMGHHHLAQWADDVDKYIRNERLIAIRRNHN